MEDIWTGFDSDVISKKYNYYLFLSVSYLIIPFVRYSFKIKYNTFTFKDYKFLSSIRIDPLNNENTNKCKYFNS